MTSRDAHLWLPPHCLCCHFRHQTLFAPLCRCRRTLHNRRSGTGRSGQHHRHKPTWWARRCLRTHIHSIIFKIADRQEWTLTCFGPISKAQMSLYEPQKKSVLNYSNAGEKQMVKERGRGKKVLSYRQLLLPPQVTQSQRGSRHQRLPGSSCVWRCPCPHSDYGSEDEDHRLSLSSLIPVNYLKLGHSWLSSHLYELFWSLLFRIILQLCVAVCFTFLPT